MRRGNDPLCPLCKEEDETSLHFLGRCCAIANIHRLHFGVPFLEPSDLRFANATNVYDNRVAPLYLIIIRMLLEVTSLSYRIIVLIIILEKFSFLQE